jgi:hypothetical protein
MLLNSPSHRYGTIDHHLKIGKAEPGHDQAKGGGTA